MNLSERDIQRIKFHGLSPEEVQRQYTILCKGLPFSNLHHPAKINDGILALNEEDRNHFAHYFDQEAKNYDVLKFVPASGAATRMFKDLYAFVAEGQSTPSVEKFLHSLSEFAFFSLLKEKKWEGLEQTKVIEMVIGKEGLNLGSMPKGLIPFHQEGDRSLTPIQSHILEAMNYSRSKNGKIAIHFTLSPEHLEEGKALMSKTEIEIKNNYGIESHIEVSIQHSSTDTIAIDDKNELIRDNEGEIVFRPGGHGALLSNLQSLEADLVYLRNIDNILPPSKNGENVFYKKVLGGYLLRLQQDVFALLNSFHSKNSISQEQKEKFLKQYSGFHAFGLSLQHNDQEWFHRLNRPIRVCGMVKNEGEPGGGPFWVTDKSGVNLQIVEAAQVSSNEDQQVILKSATHFNPVDLVCSLKDFQGALFDLKQFTDPDTALIVEKSVQGKKIKALEHPGLWNGSMAKWLTVFIEIPVSTFNPVKTVNDLLKDAHRS